METIEASHFEPATVHVAAVETRHAFEFRGSGAEYFRIWIVNLALTVLTLGIYSAWAKVRRLKYLHGHTLLDGNAFGYHGDPKKILKGRAVASLLFMAYALVGEINQVAGLFAGLALALAMPWLVVKSLKFRLRMTSWRGLHFDFDENFRAAYRVYLVWGTLAALSLGLLLPVFVRKLHRFTVDHASYGTTSFECKAPLRPFYVAAAQAVGVFVVIVAAGLAGLRLLGGGSGTPNWLALLPLIAFLVGYLVAYPFFQAGVQNAVYGHTTLGPHRVHSELRATQLAWLYLSNTVAIVVSFGLLVPWATVRTLRYRLETLAVTAVGSLDDFVRSEASSTPQATGEEIADFFDVDFGL